MFSKEIYDTKASRLALSPISYDFITGDEKSPSNGPALLELLESYPTLLSLVNNLHYSDLLNLSMVSKRIRNVILPASDSGSRFKFISRACACQKRWSSYPTSRGCFNCNVMLCNVCSQ
jgi:hypothetical protein